MPAVSSYTTLHCSGLHRRVRTMIHVGMPDFLGYITFSDEVSFAWPFSAKTSHEYERANLLCHRWQFIC